MTTIKQPNNNSKFPISNSCSRQKKSTSRSIQGQLALILFVFPAVSAITRSKRAKQANVRVPKRYSGFFLLRGPHREGIPKAVHGAGPSAQSSRKKVSGAGVIGRAPPSLIPPTFYRISATPTIPFLPCAPS